MRNDLIRRLESKRVQIHHARMERSLRRASVGHLTRWQQRKREQVLYAYGNYWRAGEFPKNETGQLFAHVFQDADGKLCGVASMIASTGRRDLVQQVAKNNNDLNVRDVKSGPILEWARDHGFSRRELIRVQIITYEVATSTFGHFLAISAGILFFAGAIAASWFTRYFHRENVRRAAAIGFLISAIFGAYLVSDFAGRKIEQHCVNKSATCKVQEIGFGEAGLS
jgi:hypothetical protein